MNENKDIKLENQNISTNLVNNSINGSNKDKNGNNLIVILVIILGIVICGIIYVLVFKDNETIKNDTNDSIQQSDSSKKYELKVYKSEDNGEWIYYGKYGKLEDEKHYGFNKDDKLVSFTIDVSTNNAKVLDTYNRMYNDKEGENAARAFVLYNDNGLYIYDAKTETSQKINLENDYKFYNLEADEKGNKIIGVTYQKNDDSIGYYNVLKGKKLYDGKYKILYNNDLDSRVNGIGDNYIQIDDMEHDKIILLSRNEEKEVLSHSTLDGTYSYTYFGDNNKIYAIDKIDNDVGTIYEAFYDNAMNKFYTRNVKSNLLVSFFNNKLYIIESTTNNDNHIKKYNIDGTLVSDITMNYTFYDIVDDYVLYNKNNMLVIQNIEDEKEIKEIDKIIDNFKYDWKYSMASYDNVKLNYYDTSNKKGMNIVVYFKEQDSNGNWGMEYLYEKGNDIIKHPIKERSDF